MTLVKLDDNWMGAIDAMMKAKEEVKKGTMQGEFTCKVCNTGTVHWGAAPSNKHTRGQCTTAGCIAWIE